MTDPALRPPWATPAGAAHEDDDQLVRLFERGARKGYSPRLHIEGAVLIADRITPIALRLGDDGILVRRDEPAPIEIAPHLPVIDPDPVLATAVALQVLGLPASRWELRGSSRQPALDALYAAAEDRARPSLDP